MKQPIRKHIIAILLLMLPAALSAQVNGEYRSAATGIWATAANWEVYSTGTGAWTTASAAPAGATAVITIRTGHTITMNTNHSCKKLTVQSGGSLVADGTSERRLDMAADTSYVINNGNIGGIAGSSEVKMNIANNPACVTSTISGTGTTSVARIRFNKGTSSIPMNSAMVIDMDMAVTSSGITAYYNDGANLNTDNGTITINAGRTVTMSGALHASAAPSGAVGGNYTYNINGTLDMVGTTAVTTLLPLGNSASVVTVNVAGTWKIGNLNAAYTGTNPGAVVLNILNGGTVDASRATTFTIGSKWFNVSGNGKLKRAVPVAAGAVTFPVGTSANAYNPATLTATTADDTVAVSVSNTLVSPIGDPTKIVTKQWTITPTGTGAGLNAAFGWQTADQASGFSQSNPLSIFRYSGTTWTAVSGAAAITGAGTIAAPYSTTATTPPATLSGPYVVGNTAAQIVLIPAVSISVTPGTTACANTNVKFTATTTNITNPHFQWKVGGINAGTDSVNFTTSTLANNSAVTVELSNTVGGPVVATSNAITMTISPAPNAGTISGSGSVCSGTTEQLTNTATGGTWSSSNTALATVSATGLVSGIAVGNVNIIYTATNSCGTATATKAMTVTLGANAGTLSGTATLCPGGTSTLSSTATGGTWSSNNTAVATVSASGVVTGVAGGTATIAYVVVNGCGRDSARQIVTVGSLPVVPAITGPASVCTGSSITLLNSAAGGAWSSGSTGVATVSATGVVTGIAAGTAVITYRVTNSCGNTAVTYSVAVGAAPVAAAVTGAANVCEGAATTLTASIAGGTWSNTNSSVLTVSAAGVVTGVAPGTDVVTYTLSNSCGSAAATKSIIVSGLPVAATLAGGDSVCLGDNMTLSTNDATGRWNSATGRTAITTDGIVTGLAAGMDTVYYSVTNNCGTVRTAHTVTVWICNPTGIRTVRSNGLEAIVYPNPNTGAFTCRVNAPYTEPVTLMLTNLMGAVVSSAAARTNEAVQFEVRPAAGIYMLTAVSAHGRAVMKVTIRE